MTVTTCMLRVILRRSGNMKINKWLIYIFLSLYAWLDLSVSLKAQDARYLITDSVVMKKTILSGDLGLSFNKVEYWHLSEQRLRTGNKQYITFNTNFNLGRNYSLLLSIYYYLNQKEVKEMSWLPDFSMMVRRDKYIPNTVFWGYSNYGDNRFTNSWSREMDVMLTGFFFLGYRIPVPSTVLEFVKIDSSSNLIATVQLNYSLKYFGQNGTFKGGLFKGKPMVTIGLQYIVIGGLYLFYNVYLYPVKSARMPWDSEYAYGFGLANRKPWRFTFAYANNTNKFPWSKDKIRSGFLYGNFTAGINYRFTHNGRKR